MHRYAAWTVAALAIVALLWFGLRTGEPGRSAPADAEGPATTGQGAAADAASAPARQAVLPPAEIEAVAASGVRIRVKRRPRIDPPAPPYGPQLAELFAASDGGDPVARYRLGLMLYQCRDVPADETGMARAIEEIHQTRSHAGWEVADPAQEERALRTAYANCLGVPAPARTDYRKLLRAAADAGLVEAQLNLMYHLPPGEYCQFIEDCTPEQTQRMLLLREESREQVDKALKAGSVEAFRTLGGWSLNEEMGTPDDVEAYANFSAYDQIQQAAGRERELGAMLAGIRKRLRPVDLIRAEERARELLSNPNCCVLTR